MKTKSKLDLVNLQKQFDQILNSLSKEEILAWVEKDKEEQCALMLSGAKISIPVSSDSSSFTVEISLNILPSYDYKSAA